MSTDQMRRAAQKMRELSGGAIPGPWQVGGEPDDGTSLTYVYSAETLTRYANADPLIARVVRGKQVEGMPKGYGITDTPEFVASWSPEVADIAALALDQHAEVHESYDCVHEPCAHEEWAARYLGEVPDGA